MKFKDSPRCIRTKAGRIDDLERKLALCREAMSSAYAELSELDDECALIVAGKIKETLDATAP